MDRCLNCQYYDRHGASGGGGKSTHAGQCRRNAPMLSPISPKNYMIEGVWPTVRDEDWCGEFKAARNAARSRRHTARDALLGAIGTAAASQTSTLPRVGSSAGAPTSIGIARTAATTDVTLTQARVASLPAGRVPAVLFPPARRRRAPAPRHVPMHDALARALADGATVVTPNRRLARHLIDEYDRAQRAAGKRAWTSARVLPWGAWLAELEREAIAAGALPPLPRSPTTPPPRCGAWRSTRTRTRDLDARSLGASATLAWDLVHAYGAGRRELARLGGGDDEPAALRALGTVATSARSRDLDATDAAGAAERIVQAAHRRCPRWRGRRVALVGFRRARRRRAARRRGASRRRHDRRRGRRARRRARRRRVRSHSRRRRRARGRARVGADASRSAIPARASASSFPTSRRGSRGSAARSARASRRARRRHARRRPGTSRSVAPLADVPLVAAALGMLALAWSSLPVGRAAALLRSRYLPDDAGDGRFARARLERAWLERGVRSVRRRRCGRARSSAPATRSPRVSPRLRDRRTRRARRDAPRVGRCVARRAAHARVAGAHARARTSTRPPRASTSSSPQFATIDAIAEGSRGARVSGARSGALARAVGRRDAVPARVAAGADPDRRPDRVDRPAVRRAVDRGHERRRAGRAPARPHPLLPIRWQRERGVPRSDAARRARVGARGYVAVVARGAGRRREPCARRRAARRDRLGAVRRAVDAAIAVPASARARRRSTHAPPLEPWPTRARRRSPRASSLRATAGTIEAQSACPFQALAAHAGAPSPGPTLAIGLTPASAARWCTRRSTTFCARGARQRRAGRAGRRSGGDWRAHARARGRRRSRGCDPSAGSAFPTRCAMARRSRSRGRSSMGARRRGGAAAVRRASTPRRRSTLALGRARARRCASIASTRSRTVAWRSSTTRPARRRRSRAGPRDVREATQLALYALRVARARIPTRRCCAPSIGAGAARRMRGRSARSPTTALRFDRRKRERASACSTTGRRSRRRATRRSSLSRDAFVRGEAAVAPRDRAVCRTCRAPVAVPDRRRGCDDDEAEEASMSGPRRTTRRSREDDEARASDGARRRRARSSCRRPRARARPSS